jgi:O-antigen/teichoic acid export membrane protein
MVAYAIVSAAAELGLEVTSARAVAGDVCRMEREISLARVVSCVGALAGAGAGAVVAFLALDGSDLPAYALVTAILTGAGIALRGYYGISVGLDRVARQGLVRIVAALCSLLAVIACLLTNRGNALSYLIVLAFLMLGLAVVSVHSLRDNDLAATTHQGWLSLYRHQWSRGRAIVIANVTGQTMLRGDHFIVGALAGLPALGQYAVASNVSEIIWYFSAALGTVLLPAIVASAAGPRRALMFERALRACLVSSCALALVVGTIAWFAVPILYGPEFRPAGLAVILQAPGMIGASIYRVALPVILTGDRERAVMAPAVTGLVTLVALSPLLSWQFGLYGAAIASSIAYTVWGGSALWRAHRVLPVSIRRVVSPRVGSRQAGLS